MATKTWISGAPAIAMVQTLTVGGTPASGQVYSVVMGINNTKSVSYSASSSDTRSTIAAALQQLLAASTYPEFQEVTWTNGSVTPLAAPAAPTLATAATGGTVAAGTYQVEITFTNAYGESLPSASASIATTGTTSTLTIDSPAASGNATGWNAYVTQAGGSTYTLQQAAGSPTAIGTNLTLTAPPTSTGAAPPSVNTSDSGIIAATAATAGVPFLLTTSATGSGTFTAATTATNSGPNDVSVAANWSSNSLPTAGDNIYITNSSQPLLYNLQALAAVVLNSLTWDTTFSGTAGLPALNANGYEEYRQRYFQIQTPLETFLGGSGPGSSLIQRDNQGQAWTVNVAATGAPVAQGRPALLLKGTNAANVLTVTRGIVGSAIDPGDTATWNGVNIGYQSSRRTDANVTLGSGCSVANIDQTGGTVAVYCAVTGTWTQQAGSAFFYGTNTVAALDVEGGTFSYQSSGTCTTLTIGTAGTVDCSSDPRARTFTATTVYGSLLDPNKTATFTNPISCPTGSGGRYGATLDLGTEIHLQRS